MPVTYATFSEFTQVYSLKGVSQADISSQWIPYGALRVNEALGQCFTTPFSSNNETAKDLSIHFGYLGLLLRTRNQTDSEELRNDLMSRVSMICSGNSPMITSSGETMFPEATTLNDLYSTTQTYKPVFDMRNAECQRVDPDWIDDLNDEDF